MKSYSLFNQLMFSIYLWRASAKEILICIFFLKTVVLLFFNSSGNSYFSSSTLFSFSTSSSLFVCPRSFLFYGSFLSRTEHHFSWASQFHFLALVVNGALIKHIRKRKVNLYFSISSKNSSVCTFSFFFFTSEGCRVLA